MVGVEVNPTVLPLAQAEVKKWGMQSAVMFLHYNGDLDSCELLHNMQFDIVFTKRVLVKVGSLQPYLQMINRRLKENGICVFIENRHGGHLITCLRKLLPRSREYAHSVTYLKPLHVQIIDQVFHVKEVRKTYLPPVCLVIAEKRERREVNGGSEARQSRDNRLGVRRNSRTTP